MIDHEKVAAALWKSPKDKGHDRVGVAHTTKAPVTKTEFISVKAAVRPVVPEFKGEVTYLPKDKGHDRVGAVEANEYETSAEEIVALRAADPLRKMYSPQKTHERSISAEDFADDKALTPAQREAVAKSLREIFEDIGLTPTEARQIVEIAKRGPPSAATEEAWIKKIDKYDDEDVALARKLVSRDPRVEAVLHHTRLGNQPLVVRLFIEKAQMAKANGWLK